MPCKCCDCVNVGKWQIKGSGGGTSDTNVVIGNGTLNNLTKTWTPLWYTSLGPTTYNLVVTCDKKEEIIDTWISTIVLCSTEAARYPEHTISLATLLPDPCKACGLSFSGETIPVNKVGSTFTAATDNEWSNQLNWKDMDGATPSGTLPGKTGPCDDDIVIKGDVLSCSLTTMPQVFTLTTDGGNIGISLSAVNATISGSSKVLLDGDCATGGVLYVTDPASFIDSSQNDGTVVGDAVFENASKNTNVISGNATLKNTASFVENATNKTFASCTGNLEMRNTSLAADSTVGGNLEMFDSSHTEFNISASGTVALHDSAYIAVYSTLKDFTGPAAFDGSSYNLGTVDGDAEFTGTTYNSGTVTGTAAFSDGCNNNGTVEGNATFTGNSWNNFGTIKSNATFSGNGLNWNIVEGNATFSDGSFNQGGTIKGNATFNGSNGNFPNGVVGGTVEGDAIFNGSVNWAESVVQGNATFNSGSNNFGTVSKNAVFNDNTTNQGTVTGTATFNDASSNLGTAGTIVCNTTGTCP